MKIFIGGLNPGITEAELLAIFGSFGNITDAKVLNTKPHQPCGFITYDSLAEAEAAMSRLNDAVHPGLTAPGKSLVVRPADPKGVKTLLSGQQLATCRYGEIFIGNLPLDAGEEYLKGMLAMVSTQVMSLKVHRTGTGPPCGFVTFSSQDESERMVLALNGIPNGAAVGKTLNVHWAGSERGEKREPGEDFDSRLPVADNRIGPPAAKKMHVALRGPGGEVPANNLPEKVFIGGLPHHISEEDVSAMCGASGGVLSVRLIKKEAKPTTALVQFSTQEEAESAITAFHDYKAFDERPLNVKFAAPLRNPLAVPVGIPTYGY